MTVRELTVTLAEMPPNSIVRVRCYFVYGFKDLNISELDRHGEGETIIMVESGRPL